MYAKLLENVVHVYTMLVKKRNYYICKKIIRIIHNYFCIDIILTINTRGKRDKIRSVLI